MKIVIPKNVIDADEICAADTKPVTATQDEKQAEILKSQKS